MLFWLTTAFFICTTTALESQGRDLALINLAPQDGNTVSTSAPVIPGSSAPGSIFLGSPGEINIANPSSLSLDSNGNFAKFEGNSQTLGNGVVLVESPKSESQTAVFDFPCGGNITRVRGTYEGRIVPKDARCGKATVIQNSKILLINSPTISIDGNFVICPCGGIFTTARGSSAMIYVDKNNCARDSSGNVDGMPYNCSCGCEGVSPQGTEYKIGKAPSCQEIPTMAGGSTVIINKHPDLNADPLGLFPFVNINNAPNEGGYGFGGFPGGFGGYLGGYGGYPVGYGGYGWFPGGYGGRLVG